MRIVTHDMRMIAEADVTRAWRYRDASDHAREGIAKLPAGKYEGVRAPASWGACIVRFDGPTELPLYYDGEHTSGHSDYSLPSGWHNVWGCGNDFDTDAHMIHPDDIADLVAAMEREEIPL